jgi:hypothetical protein
MPSSLSTTLLLLGLVFVTAGIVTAGLIIAVLGALFEGYLFYKGGVV